MGDALYRQVADGMRSAIRDGTYREGSQLPSESELASEYGVSRGTVRQAFAALRSEGVIASRQGARRVVVGTRLQGFDEFRSFSLWARGMGAVPSGRVVSLVRRTADDAERDHLDLDPGAEVFHMTRVRFLDGQPVMIERTAYPSRIGERLSRVDAETGSITEALEREGVVFAQADHVIDAVAATAEDARLLSVRPQRPLLRTRRRTVDGARIPVEWSDDRYVGDAVAFTVRNSISANALSRSPQ